MRRRQLIGITALVVLIGASIYLIGARRTAVPSPAYGYTPLHWAALDGNASEAKALLARGADPNAATAQGEGLFGPPEGEIPLHLAAEYGHTRVVEILLTHRARPNAVDEDGQTPLHRSVQMKHPDVVRLLVSKGADINAADENGYTALFLASWEEDTRLAEYLLKCGARVVPDENGGTALHNAACHGGPGQCICAEVSSFNECYPCNPIGSTCITCYDSLTD